MMKVRLVVNSSRWCDTYPRNVGTRGIMVGSAPRFSVFPQLGEGEWWGM